jgi:hypothetical protein
VTQGVPDPATKIVVEGIEKIKKSDNFKEIETQSLMQVQEPIRQAYAVSSMEDR